MMHILITVNAAWNLINFRKALLAALLEDGHRITVLAPRDDKVPQLEAMGCTFVPLEMDGKGLSPRRDGALILRLRRHFRTLEPDVVLSFTIKNNIFGALAARGLGLPVLPNVTGLGTAFLSGRVLRMVAETLYRVAFARAPLVFFQNRDDAALFRSRGLVREGQDILLPGSGVDTGHFARTAMPEGRKQTRFLLIARLLRDKGVGEYAEAARLLQERNPQAVFALLGPLGANNRSAISAETLAAWRTEGLVEYLGETDDVRPFIAEADCVVLPSYREGAPRTLLEAAAMGRPVIATDVPGCRQVVEAEVTGLLCRAQDAGSLAEACQRFLDMPDATRAAMGQAGRDRVEALYRQEIVIDAYRSALAGLGR
jgi:glycosyltransferase involved in cell wall biosynthesis